MERESEDSKKHGAKLKVEFYSAILQHPSLRSKSSQGTFNNNIATLLVERKARKFLDNGLSVEPKILQTAKEGEKFRNLLTATETVLGVDQDKERVALAKREELTVKHSFTTMNVTMDDIATQISLSIQSSSHTAIFPTPSESEQELAETRQMPLHIKLILRESENILLYEKVSVTAAKDSAEAELISEDNKIYDYLTIGKGKNRRKMDAETQTVEVLYKTRNANTERIKMINFGTFVSNYNMFDTYADLETVVTENDSEKTAQIRGTMFKQKGGSQFDWQKIYPKLKLAVILTQRLLASNVFHDKQKRFRNMSLPDPLLLSVKYSYQLKDLWKYKTIEAYGKAVSDFDWCPSNSDLLAVAYGLFNFIPQEDRRFGVVCIWSMKNPINPERKYRYSYPVTAVTFSKQNPQLLAVGLYNGQIEIIDITESVLNRALVAVSERSTSPGMEPITGIKWIYAHNANSMNHEQLLSSSQDGTIMKYSLTSGVFLVGFQQIRLDRVEGFVEGIRMTSKTDFIEAERHPQALMIRIHPEKPDMYFIGTDEGCIYKCSTNFPHQHIDTVRIHNGSVFAIEYSPWSPKIFLSCGGDWRIRIWAVGIIEPLINLSSGIGPIHTACWSPIFSTILLATTRNAVEIWDIRRSILKPVTTRTFSSGAVYLTKAGFSVCGRSVVVGDEDGSVHICTLEDMPFPSHFQFNELRSAVFKALVANPELTRQLENLGFLGYPNGNRNPDT